MEEKHEKKINTLSRYILQAASISSAERLPGAHEPRYFYHTIKLAGGVCYIRNKGEKMNKIKKDILEWDIKRLEEQNNQIYDSIKKSKARMEKNILKIKELKDQFDDLD